MLSKTAAVLYLFSKHTLYCIVLSILDLKVINHS